MFKHLLQSCAAAVLLASAAMAADPAADAQALVVDVRQGNVFSFALPRGWNCNETICGVDMTAPDGVTGVSHLFFHGHTGRTSPDGMVQFALRAQGALGILNTRILSSKELSPNCKIYLSSFTFHGRELRGLSICAAFNQPFGGFFTECVNIQALPEAFDQNTEILMQVAQSVTCVNIAAFCGGDQLIQLQPSGGGGAGGLNHPNTGGDLIMSAWENKNRSRDRTNRNWSDAMLGRSRWTSGGTQYLAPSSATRVFVTPGGTAYYKKDWNSPPPPNTTEIQRAR